MNEHQQARGGDRKMILAAWYHGVLAFFFAVVAVFVMILVLVQRGRGVGLAGAFGGTGGHTAFGAKTGDFLTWATVVVAAILLVYAILLNFVFVRGKIDLGPGTPAAPIQETIPPGETGSLWQMDEPAGLAPLARGLIFGEDLA
jgi:preprotein translocase subunit SecG